MLAKNGRSVFDRAELIQQLGLLQGEKAEVSLGLELGSWTRHFRMKTVVVDGDPYSPTGRLGGREDFFSFKSGLGDPDRVEMFLSEKEPFCDICWLYLGHQQDGGHSPINHQVALATRAVGVQK